MREEKFYLWHTIRQGWLTRAGSTHTDIQHAMAVSDEEAMRLIRNSRDHNGTPTVLPVLVRHAEAV